MLAIRDLKRISLRRLVILHTNVQLQLMNSLTHERYHNNQINQMFL